MRTEPQMFTSTIARAAYAAGVAVLGLSGTALAQSTSPYAIALDLRVQATGGKEVTVNTIGETVLMDLYVTVFGLDADPLNDGLQSISGGFKSSTGGVGG